MTPPERKADLPGDAPALVITEYGQVALARKPVPAPASGEVLIETHYSGVSVGTELWAATDQHGGWGEPPFVPGYQVAGRVAALGDDVAASGLAVGDLVACFTLTDEKRNGAHQKYVIGEVELTHRIGAADSAEPDQLLVPAALFVQPAVGANALNHAGIDSGCSVLVIGQGLIGQATAQLARLRGAYVIGTDVSPQRLEIAGRFCVDRVIDAGAEPVHEQIADEFPEGVDVVIESTGFNRLVDDGMRCLRSHGTFVFEGFYPGNLSFEFRLPHQREVHAVFPCFIGERSNREAVLRLLSSGQLDLRPLISDLHDWSQAADVYRRLFTEQRDSFNAIVFDWREAR